MKVVSSHGSGPRGRLLAVAGLVFLVAGLAMFLGGCGNGDDNADAGSQLDDGANAEGSATVGDVGGAGGASDSGEPQEDVMVGYSWDSCMADMTFRYADEDTAQKVCDSIRAGYSDRESSELDSVLATVETQENVSPNQGGGSTGGGTGGNGGTGGTGGNGGTGGDSGNGWGEIEIQVPPAP